MRNLAAIVVISLGGPAHAQSLSERSGRNWLLGISPSIEDFIREVVLGELFETELNRAAETRGNAKTKAFAAAMLKEQADLRATQTLVQSGRVNRLMDDQARR